MSNPCKVCGGTDMNLVDGYYYCVECGTQDANVRETIVEMTVLADGTIANTERKKLTTKLKEGVQMSGEWYKWHAYNFILSGLTEELISLGAAPTLRSKVLWIWTRYIKKFQNKKELGDESKQKDRSKSEDATLLYDEDSDLEIGVENPSTDHKATFTQRKLLTILYIALNLDHSDIQLSHLLRFMKEGRLSFDINKKFIPTEIKTKYIPLFNVFRRGDKYKRDTNIREYAMNYFKCLDLGIPVVPNITKIIDNYMKELCLPLDFRDFILALLHLVPCDFLHIDEVSMTYLVRIPNYEVIIMSYVLLGLKICFGLDDDYEKRLSNVVDIVNCQENHPKSYDLGFLSEQSNRLFSFHDWYNYLHLRKIMLSKYYIHAGHEYGLPTDDYVLLEQLPKPLHRQPTFSDHVSMDILNKIHTEKVPQVISIDEFPPSLTSITTNLNVISPHIQDQDIKLLLCEDFSQYSLKYVTGDLKLPDFQLKGVSKNNKTVEKYVSGCLPTKNWSSEKHMIYVRNCDNNNWLKTNQPSADHIEIYKQNTYRESEAEDVHNLNYELNTPVSNRIDKPSDEKIEEESTGLNIFDDEFEHNDEIKTNNNTEPEIIQNGYFSDENDASESVDLFSSGIDRNQIIQELIEIASNKYNISIPKESAKPKKRKIFAVLENNGEKVAKKRKNEKQVHRDVARQSINDLVSAYYTNLHTDVLNTIEEGVRAVVQAVANQNTTHLELEQSVSEENNSNLCVISETKSIDEENISNLCVISETKSISEDNISNGIICIDETKVDNENEVNIDGHDMTQQNGDIDDLAFSDTILIPRINPDFDANTHITDQLYIKVEHLNDMQAFDFWDENLENIIDKNIHKKEESVCEVLESKEDLTEAIESSDSEDDLPLNVLKEAKQFQANKEKFTNIEFEPLFTRRDMSKYRFWIRHYHIQYFNKLNERTHKRFNCELRKYFPKSFVFLLKECSDLVDCSPFMLYRTLQNLELRFMNYNDY